MPGQHKTTLCQRSTQHGLTSPAPGITIRCHYLTLQHNAFTKRCLASRYLNKTAPLCFTETRQYWTLPLLYVTLLHLTNAIRYCTEPNRYITMRYDTELYLCSTLLCVTSPMHHNTILCHNFTSPHDTFTLAGQHNATPRLYWTKLYLYITSRH